MRPEILFPLYAPIASLKGVGPRVAPLLEKLANRRQLGVDLPTCCDDALGSPRLRIREQSIRRHIETAAFQLR